MRIATSLFVLAIASPAFADNGKGLSLDFGYVRNQVAVTDQTVPWFASQNCLTGISAHLQSPMTMRLRYCQQVPCHRVRWRIHRPSGVSETSRSMRDHDAYRPGMDGHAKTFVN